MNKIKKLIQEEINNLLLESYSKVLDDLFKAAKGAKKAEDLFSQLKNIPQNKQFHPQEQALLISLKEASMETQQNYVF